VRDCGRASCDGEVLRCVRGAEVVRGVAMGAGGVYMGRVGGAQTEEDHVHAVNDCSVSDVCGLKLV